MIMEGRGRSPLLQPSGDLGDFLWPNWPFCQLHYYIVGPHGRISLGGFEVKNEYDPKVSLNEYPLVRSQKPKI
jgi:hypothetical protein